MKTEELRKKEVSELKKILGEEREKLRKLRFDIALGKIKNFSEIKKTKRNIARILTILREKGIKI